MSEVAERKITVRKKRVLLKQKREQNQQQQVVEEVKPPKKAERRVYTLSRDRVRTGKTQKDRQRGCQKKNRENKLERASWCKDPNRTIANFPWHTCNGKRFPTQVTSHEGHTRKISYKVGPSKAKK